MRSIFSFKGKIGRGKFLGISMIYLFAFLMIVGNTSDFIGGLTTIFYILINTMLASKRLRDIGRSSWLALLYLLPPAGVVLYVILALSKGKPGQTNTNTIGIKNKKIDLDKKADTLEELQENVFRILEDAIG